MKISERTWKEAKETFEQMAIVPAAIAGKNAVRYDRFNIRPNSELIDFEYMKGGQLAKGLALYVPNLALATFGATLSLVGGTVWAAKAGVEALLGR